MCAYIDDLLGECGYPPDDDEIVPSTPMCVSGLEVEGETPKAILVYFTVKFWLPKSQVKQEAFSGDITMPYWLSEQKAEEVRQQTDKMLVQLTGSAEFDIEDELGPPLDYDDNILTQGRGD